MQGKRKDIFVSNSGSPFRSVFKLKSMEDGSKDLVVVGQYNFQEEIESHADSVDINNILDRYARGDISVLNRVASVYGDFTTMPTTLGELSQRILDANDLFNNLDIDVRREFDFDAGKFFNSLGTEKFNNVVEKYAKNAVKQSDPVVTPVEPVVTPAEPVIKESEVK